MKILKKMFFCFIALLMTAITFAQNVPQTMSYQAVARSEKGTPIAEKEIIIEISIRKTTSNGTVEYQETHNPTTNEFGLFEIEIGEGENTFAGTVNEFSEIEWLSGIYYLQIRADFGTGALLNGLIDMGTSKLQSVPYSFAANRAEIADSLSKIPYLKLTQLSDVNITTPLDKQLVGWDADAQKWIAADPTGDPGVFVRTDGTVDLISDWTISTNNITLTNGTITAQILSLNSGTSVNEISADVNMTDNSDDAVPTERAVKNYVDNIFASSPWLSDASYIYNIQDKNIGIGNSSPDHKFQVDLETDEGILFNGAFGSNVPDLNAGTRMTFYPGKASFRAGRINAQTDYWNNANVGDYSAAFGYDTKAAGDCSFAAGGDTQVEGSHSVAFGRNNQVVQPYSFSAGSNNSVGGAYSGSFGRENSPGAPYSFTLGRGNTVIGSYGFAIGRYNRYFSNALFMIGYGDNASDRENVFVVLNDSKTGIGIGNSSPDYLLEVGVSGDGTEARANQWLSFSDERLKKDLKKIENPVSKIKKLNGYYFYWKDGKDKSRQVGVIAQEIEKVLPEIVSQKNSGYKSVDYSKLTALLIETAKKQQELIEKLQIENNELAVKNSELKKKLENNIKRIVDIEKYIKAEANIDMNK